MKPLDQYGHFSRRFQVSGPAASLRVLLPLPGGSARVVGISAYAEAGPTFEAQHQLDDLGERQAGFLDLGSPDQEGYFLRMPVLTARHFTQADKKLEIFEPFAQDIRDFWWTGRKWEFTPLNRQVSGQLGGFYTDTMLQAAGFTEPYLLNITLRYER